MNPFDKYKRGFTQGTTSPLGFMDGISVGASAKSQGQRDAEKANVAVGQSVQFPRHLFIPEGARSLDLRRLAIIAAGTNSTLMSFTAPEGSTCFFTSYAVFNDGLDASLIEFVPTVNFNRIFPFHGNPNDNFRISLGLGPDLTNNSLIDGQLQVNPGETLRWVVVNNAAVDVAMGVRMKGYIDSATSRTNRVFGG